MPLGAEPGLSARARMFLAKGIGIYILIWLAAFLFMPAFFIRNVQILLPSFAVILIFLCFSLWLRFQVQANIFGEIGFIYLAFAVAYTVFPAYGFLALDSLSSGVGFENLAASVVGSKAANGGQVKTGQRMWPGTWFFYPIFS
ncbi:MAG: hypothetical protein WAN12_04195 [Candidatus Acidiferrum sp.]